MIFFLKRLGYFIKDNPKVSAMIFVGLLVVILFGYQQCSNQFVVNQKEAEIEQLKEQRATESQQRIDEAKTEANTAKNQVKEVQQTDSNKYSKNKSDADNQFCEYFCLRGVIDSSCQEWAKQNNKVCTEKK